MFLLRKIFRLFIMQWSVLLQYRADTILWMLSEAATPLVTLAVWYVVAQSSSGPLTPQETLTYYILAILVTLITNAWNGFFLAREILNGDIARYLVKPLSPFWIHIAQNLMEKAHKLVIPLPLLIGGFVLFSPYFSAEIYRPWHIFLFLLSLPLAAILSFSVDISLGLLAFWFEDATEIRNYQYVLFSAASGLIIPFVMMPEAVRTGLSFLPFRYILSAPIELLMGQAEGAAALQLFAVQIAWVIASILIIRILWVRGLKRYAVPGQ